MSLIYWDTMLFVYFFEDHPKFGPRTRQIWEQMRQRGDTLCTSVFTIGELLTGPLKRGDRVRADQMRDALKPPVIETLPFTIEVAGRYAQIRAANRVSAGDTIHLATAAIAKANLFLTNDHKIAKLNIPGIDFVAGLDVNVF